LQPPCKRSVSTKQNVRLLASRRSRLEAHDVACQLAIAERKRSLFEDLFKTQPYQRMTVQIRVNDLDLDILGTPSLD